MTIVGFHASHEQLDPRSLLRAVQLAELAGFGAAMCSDHFAPWSVRQGHSGHAWSWLGAALASTELTFGVVTAPGQRYHPAVAAQAYATLAQLFPGRFWVALGSGEALNEHITGDAWPPKEQREARLDEAVDVIRSLLAGEEVDRDGLVRVHRATIWSRPDDPPPLFAAAVSPQTAERVAAWADGLVTVEQPPDVLRDVIDRYRGNGGRGPVCLQAHLSWAPSDDEALAIACEQWRQGVLDPPLLWDLDDPRDFDRLTADASDDRVREKVFVSSDPAAHLDHLGELVALGFDRVYLHHVGQQQEAFIETFGRDVVTQLTEVGA